MIASTTTSKTMPQYAFFVSDERWELVYLGAEEGNNSRVAYNILANKMIEKGQYENHTLLKSDRELQAIRVDGWLSEEQIDSGTV